MQQEEQAKTVVNAANSSDQQRRLERQPDFDAALRRPRGPLGWLALGRPLSRGLWQALGDGYLRGDGPADRLVAWMATAGPARVHPLLARALRDGIASVPEAPPPLRAFFEDVEARPAWLDEALLRRGALTCQRAGVAAHHALRDGGLMPGYLAAPINQTLLLTGALERGARRRLGETMQWWLDCTEVGGMERGAAGFRSTLHVRLMHAFVRRRVGQLSQWRADAWGVPVSQSDMAGTYLVFAVAFLVGLRVLGVPVTDDDARAVVHLWRYVGWLMGVEDRWLIEDEAAGRFLLLHVALSQPEPDESCALLGRALMDEPLSREYPNLGWLRGPLNRSRHLSVTRLFVSGPQLRALGLPRFGVPWYPLLSAPLTLAWHGLHRLLPGGQERLARSGRARQQALLRPQFGEQRPTLGRLHGT